MIITMEQDELLRKYTIQISEESFKLKNKNMPQEIKNALIDIDDSNVMLYGKHLIVDIKQIKGR